ncbi:GNAT family N-acetyltransferase [Galactobacter caseinivorans]|uniref:GNAT family N-acetyltransferase n=1 Tax=Galactobacter caseinivorans TaxID=2676123 RepID=UPI001F3849A5|nr:GNAT family N-acetyltransferase [Galactobacter caseinivorans]
MSHPRTTSRSLVARFLGRGPLERLPKRPDDREALLDLIAWQVLPAGSTEDEPGLNLRLRGFTEDTAMLRRALVDHGRVERAKDGSLYTGLVQRPEITIRPAQESDDAEINRLTVASYLEAGHFPDAKSGYLLRISTSASARRTEAETWVAERGELMMGSVTLAEHGGVWADVAGPGELEFRLLTVDPAVQRSGTGRALVQAILEEGRRRPHIHRVVLSTNQEWTAANDLYREAGFQRFPERDWTPEARPDLILRGYAKDV